MDNNQPQGVFNQRSRKKNAFYTIVVGVVCNLILLISGFAYRSVFLEILSNDYLGIDGLFTGIFNYVTVIEWSLVGVTSFHMYSTIYEKNEETTCALIRYYRKLLRDLAVVIVIFGFILLFFLKYLIKDLENVPDEINIYVVLGLYIFKTLSTFLFYYKTIILYADQKFYLFSAYTSGVTIARFAGQLVLLYLTHNYYYTIITAIVINLVANGAIDYYLSVKYKSLFSFKSKISREKKKEIDSEIGKSLLHNVGEMVVGCTDNFVLSSVIGIAASGLYSNYYMIYNHLLTLFSQIIGNFNANIGNSRLGKSKEESYKVYKQLIFVNRWLDFYCGICIFFLINDFIELWLGAEYCFNLVTVSLIALQFMLYFSRKVNTSYTNSSGLYVKDKIRPLIEALLNLSLSIILARKIGIAGVFLGTVISNLLTIFWREPLVLYRYEFEKEVKEYWLSLIKPTVISAVYALALYILWINTDIKVSVLCWILKGVFITVSYGLIIILFEHKSEEFISLKEAVKGLLVQKLVKPGK